MNCIRPAVGSMFYEAIGALKASPASIPPVRVREGESRVIVETYPRLVADRLIGNNNYKEADGLEGVRQRIVDDLCLNAGRSTIKKWYGLAVTIADGLVEQCVNDRDGDRLDSVLCAVQAAWAYRSPNHGMPTFASTVLQNVVALEGWVADPLLDRWLTGIA